jgi:hypothetical protein
MDEWRDGFLTQARLLEVPGPAIGEALAEVEAHCADSGQQPDEAFGPPDRYARELAQGLRVRSRGASRARDVSLAASALAGIFLLLAAADGVSAHRAAPVTTGDLASVLLGAAAVLLVVEFGLATRARSSRAMLAASLAGGFFVAIAPRLLWRQPLFQLPVPVALPLGLVLLLAAWWSLGWKPDRVLDPRTGREPFHVPRLGLLAVRALPPLLLCGAVLLVILLPTGR